MSTNFFDSRKSSPPEKSNFAQTCNLLSQFLKEKGGNLSLRDLNLGISGNPEASGRPETSTGTTILPPLTDKSGQISAQHVNLFPKSATMGGSFITTSSEAAAMEPKTAQMTIFYAGQVFVFDDFSTDKAKEVMLLASNGTAGYVGTSSSAAAATGLDKFSSSSMPSAPSNIPSSLLGTSQKETQPVGSDLPIARRASLYRFLEKRNGLVQERGINYTTKEQFDLNL